MLRLTRGALTMLLAEYRSVLKNAYIKNAVVAAVAVGVAVATPAYADDTTDNNDQSQSQEEGKDSDTGLCENNNGKCTLEDATISKNYSTDKAQYGKSVKISGGTNAFNNGSSLNATEGDITISGGTTTLDGTTFKANQNVSLNSGSLIVKGTNTLNGNQSVKLSGTNLTTQENATLNVTGSPLSVTGGTITNKGTITTTKTEITGGSINLYNGSKFTANNGVTVDGGTINANGNSTVSDLEVKKGTVSVNSNATLDTGKLTMTAGTIKNSGTLNTSSTTLSGGTVNLTNGTLTSSGNIAISGANITASNGNNTIEGQVTLTGGNITTNSGSSLNVSGQSLTASGGTITNNGTLALNSTTTFNGANVTNKGTLNVASNTKVNSGVISNTGTLNASKDLSFADNTITNTGTLNVTGGTTTFAGLKDNTLGGTLNVGKNGTANFSKNTTVTNITVDGTLNVSGGTLSVKEGGSFTMNGSTEIGTGNTLDLTTIENTTFGETAFDGTKVKNNGTIKALHLNLEDSNKDGTTKLINTGDVDAIQLIASGNSSNSSQLLDISGISDIDVGPRSGLDPDGNEYNDPTKSLEGFTDVNITGDSSLAVNNGVIDLKSITLNQDGQDFGTFELTGNKSWIEGSQFTQSEGKSPLTNQVDTVTINKGTVDAKEGLVLNSTELGITDKTIINASQGIQLNQSTLHLDLGANEDKVDIKALAHEKGIANAHAIVSDQGTLQYYNDESVILITGVQGGKITISDTDVDGNGINDLGDIYEKLGIGISAASAAKSGRTDKQTINDDSRALLDIRDANGKKVEYEYAHRNKTNNGTTAIDIKDILDSKNTNKVTNVATAAAQTDAFTDDRINDITKNEIIDQKLRVGSLNAQSDSTQVTIDANVKLFNATKNNKGDEDQGYYHDKTNAEDRVFVSRTNADGDTLKISHAAGETYHKLDGHKDGDSLAEAEKLLGVKLKDQAWLGLYNGGAIGFVEADGSSSGTLYITGGRTTIKTDDRLDKDRSSVATTEDPNRDSSIGTKTYRIKKVEIDKTTAVAEDYRYQNSDTTKNAAGVRENLRDSYATNFNIYSLNNAIGEFVVRTFDTAQSTSLRGILDVENTLKSGSLSSYGIYEDSKSTKFKDSSKLIVKNDAEVTGSASLAHTLTTVQDVNGKYRSFTAGSLNVTGAGQGKTTSQINAGEIKTTSGNITINNSYATAHGGLAKDGTTATTGNIYSAAALTSTDSIVEANDSIESKTNMSHTGSTVTAENDVKAGGTFYSSNSHVTAQKGDVISKSDMTVQDNSHITANGKVQSDGKLSASASYITAETSSVTSAGNMLIDKSEVTAQTAVSSNGTLTAQKNSTVTATTDAVTSEGDMTVNASTVKAQTDVSSGGKLTASANSNVTAISGDVTSSGDMSITSSTVNAHGKVESSGILSATSNSSITAQTGDITSGKTMTVTSSKVEATAGSISSKDALTSTGSTMTAKNDITAVGNISATNSDVNAGGKFSSDGSVTVTNTSVDASSVVVKGKLTTAKGDGTKSTYIKTTSADGITADGTISVGENTSVETAKLIASDGKLDAITVDGTLNVTSAQAVVSDKDLTVNGTMKTGGDITANNVSNSGTITSAGAFTANGNLTNSGNLTSREDLTISGTTDTSAGSISSTAGSLLSTGLFTMSGNASVSAHNDGTFNGGLKMNSAQNSLNVTTGDLTVDSSEFVLNGGTVNVQTGNATFKKGADITGKLAIKQNITVNDEVLKVGENTQITAGSNITLDKGAEVKSGSTLAAAGNIKSAGNVTLADNTTVKANDLQVTGTLKAGTHTTLTSGNTTVSNGASFGDNSTVNTGNITVSQGNLSFGKSSSVNTGNITVSTGDLTVDGGENTATTVNATNIEVTQGELTVATNSAIHASGNANVKEGGTVNGTFKVDGTLTSDKNFTVSEGGDLTALKSEYDQNFYVYGTSTIGDLTMKSGTEKDIYIGYTGAVSESGTLITDTLRLNGRHVFIDPDYSKDASILATLSFGGKSDSNYTTLDGDLLLGQNAVISVGEQDTTSLFSLLHSISEESGDNFMSTASGSNAFTTDGNIQNLLYLNKSLRIADGSGFYSEKDKTFITSKTDTSNLSADANHFTWGSGTGLLITEKVSDYVNLDRNTRAAVYLENAGAKAVTVTNSNNGRQTIYLSGNISRSEASRFPVFTTSSLGYANSKAATADGSYATVVSSEDVSNLNNTSYYGTVLLDGVTQMQYLSNVDVEFVNNSYYDYSQANVYLLVDGTLSIEGIVGVKASAVDLYDYLSNPAKAMVLNALTKYSSDDGLGAKYIVDRTDPSSGKDIEETSRLGIYGGMYQAAQGVATAASEAALSAVGFGAVLPEAYIGEDIAVWTVLNYNNVNADSYSAEGQHYGVDIDLRGITIGGDHLFENGARLGIFGSIGDGSSRGKDIGSNVTNDFDYYGFGAYGHYPVTENFELFGDVYMMKLSGDIYQYVDADDYGTLKGDAHMKVYSASLYGKYTFDNEIVDVAPYAGIIFSHYKLDKFDVKSKDGVIASLEDGSQNVISFPVGVTLSSDFRTENEWNLKPIFDARMTFNAGDRDVDSKVLFSGVDESQNFNTQVLDDITYGASLKFEASRGAGSIGIGVSYVGSSHTDNYGVTANARYQF